MSSRYYCFLFVLAAGYSCHAQFRLDIRQVAKGQTGESIPSESNQEIQEAVQVQAIQQLGMRPARIRVRFGNVNRLIVTDPHSATKSIHALKAELEMEIALLEIEQQLTSEQKERLLLAGRRDVASITELAESIERKLRDAARMQDVLQEAREMDRKVKAGVGGPGSMMAKVAKRILTSTAGDGQHSTRLQRTQFAYRSAMKLIVTQLDLVAPLTRQQRDALNARISDAELPREMTEEMTYSFALKELLLPENGPKHLTPSQLKHLKELRRGVVLGNARPHGLIKSRRSIVRSLRK